MAVLQRATGETRRQHLHLHLQLRSDRLRNGTQVGAHGDLHHLRNGGDFVFLDRIPEKSTGVHHEHCTYSAVQSLHKRGTHRTRLAQELHNIFVRLKRICHLVLHMSHPLLFSHLPFTTSTSSSSFTLPSTTTPEHALQSGPHDPLQEHPVHHEPLQDLPADNERHQESVWCENLKSGGNPLTTFSTRSLRFPIRQS